MLKYQTTQILGSAARFSWISIQNHARGDFVSIYIRTFLTHDPVKQNMYMYCMQACMKLVHSVTMHNHRKLLGTISPHRYMSHYVTMYTYRVFSIETLQAIK